MGPTPTKLALALSLMGGGLGNSDQSQARFDFALAERPQVPFSAPGNSQWQSYWNTGKGTSYHWSGASPAAVAARVDAQPTKPVVPVEAVARTAKAKPAAQAKQQVAKKTQRTALAAKTGAGKERATGVVRFRGGEPAAPPAAVLRDNANYAQDIAFASAAAAQDEATAGSNRVLASLGFVLDGDLYAEAYREPARPAAGDGSTILAEAAPMAPLPVADAIAAYNAAPAADVAATAEPLTTAAVEAVTALQPERAEAPPLPVADAIATYQTPLAPAVEPAASAPPAITVAATPPRPATEPVGDDTAAASPLPVAEAIAAYAAPTRAALTVERSAPVAARAAPSNPDRVLATLSALLTQPAEFERPRRAARPAPASSEAGVAVEVAAQDKAPALLPVADAIAAYRQAPRADVAAAGAKQTPTVVVAGHADRVMMSLANVIAAEGDAQRQPGAQTAQTVVANQSEKVLATLAAVRAPDAHERRSARGAEPVDAVDVEIEVITDGAIESRLSASRATPVRNGMGEGWQVLAAAQLDEVRGGFMTDSGLKISFGIERAVYINGSLVTTTSLNVKDFQPVRLANGVAGGHGHGTKGSQTADANDSLAAGLAALAELGGIGGGKGKGGGAGGSIAPTNHSAGVPPPVTTPSAVAAVVPAAPAAPAAAGGVGAVVAANAVPPVAGGTSAPPGNAAQAVAVAPVPTPNVPAVEPIIAPSAPLVAAATPPSSIAAATSTPPQPTSASNPGVSSIVAHGKPIADPGAVRGAGAGPVGSVGVIQSGGSVGLIQSGSGNTATAAGAINAANLGTMIQNTLNDQKIQNVTVINAVVNSLQILKSVDLQSTLRNALTDSLRR